MKYIDGAYVPSVTPTLKGVGRDPDLSHLIPLSYQGDQGIQGPQGVQGDGSQGRRGQQGYAGGPGVQGRQGNQGITGAGYQGPIGGQGSEGVQGYQGLAGAGEQGDRGNQGYQGHQGLGIQGDTGLQGDAGVGVQGYAGTKGDQGDQGAVGQGSTIPGPQGDAGSQGNVGAASTIPGPQGDVGAASTIPGPQGDVGSQGITGTDGTGVNILGSLESEGDAPPSGNVVGDAYIIEGVLWVWGGTSWTEAGEIKGPQGVPGANSTVPGPQGEIGWQGAEGTVGPQGDNGSQGSAGTASTVPGPQGNDGDDGFQGAVGAASTVPGPQGNDGTPGSVGAASTVPGPQGNNGAQGGVGAASTVPGPQGNDGAVGAASTVPGPQGSAFTTNTTGMLKGTGAGVVAATPDTDYLTPTGNGSGLTGITQSQVANLVTDLAGKVGTANSPIWTGMHTFSAPNSPDGSTYPFILAVTGGSTSRAMNVSCNVTSSNAIYAVASGSNGTGVYGQGTSLGVYGKGAYGVKGEANAAADTGVFGYNYSINGASAAGVLARAHYNSTVAASALVADSASQTCLAAITRFQQGGLDRVVWNNDGTQTIALGYGNAIPVITKAIAAKALSVSNKALTSNVATLTTSAVHGFRVGEVVVVASVDATFNGTWTITVVPSTTTFSYAKTNANVTSTAATGTATVSQSANLAEWQTSAGVVLASLSADTSVFNMPTAFAIGAGAHGVLGSAATAVGNLATATGSAGTSLGHNSQATGVASVGIGASTAATGSNSVAIGSAALATAGNGVAIGPNAWVSGTATNGIAIGLNAVASGSHGIVLGNGAANSVANQFSIGSASGTTNEVMVTASTASGFALTGRVLSSTSTARNAGRLQATLPTTTDASFRGRLAGLACDSSGTDREGWRVESDGSQPLLGFYGNTAVAKPTGDIGTALVSLGLMASTSGSTQLAKAGTSTTIPRATQGGPTATFTVNNVVLTSNVATITTTAAHGFAVGQAVTVAGLTNSALNGTYTITVVGSTTAFSYALTNANITSGADSGTAIGGQTANLDEWRTTAGTVLASISNLGYFSAPRLYCGPTTLGYGYFYNRAGSSNLITFNNGQGDQVELNGAYGIGFAGARGLIFGATVNAQGGTDVGLIRPSAGILQITNGNGSATAVGSLISGSPINLQATSSTTLRSTGLVASGYLVSTDASRTGYLDLQAADSTGTNRTGVRVGSDGTQPLLGFYGGTAVAKPSGDIGTALSALGLISSPTVSTSSLGTGTANATTYLRGDNTWSTPPGGGGAGADANASYIVQTAPNSPANAQVLGSLPTGLLLVTTSTGVLSSAVANTDYLPVASPTTMGTLTAANFTYTGALVSGVTATTASGTVTLTASSAQYQFIDPNGANRDVMLPTAATGMTFTIKNKATSGAFLLLVKNAAAVQIGNSLPYGGALVVVYDGATWQVI